MMVQRKDGCQLLKLHLVKSPRFPHYTRNNRSTALQRNAIGIRKPKFKHSELRSVDVTAEAKNHLHANLVAKIRYSQIDANLKTKSDKPKLELEAKGQSAPIFLMRIHPRALERRIKFEEVQQRRDAIEYERIRAIFANEKTPCFFELKEKRQRIKDYVQERLAKKELKILKAQQRTKFLIDLEKAKEFERERLLAHAIGKFRNIIRWKIRNQNASIELRQRILSRSVFGKWKQRVIYIWGGQKERAVTHHNRHCLKAAWTQWQQDYSIARSHKCTAEDWFDMRLSERVFKAWKRGIAQIKYLSEMKKMQADAHYNWFLKWRVLERWRCLHAILEIEKEAEDRRERWRFKANELIHEC